MPAKIQKGFSVTILTALATSIILAIIGWSGSGTLKAYSNEIDVGYVKNQLDTMNETMIESLIFFHATNKIVSTNLLKLEYCKGNFVECKMHMDAHLIEFNILRGELIDSQKVLIEHRQRLHQLEVRYEK